MSDKRQLVRLEIGDFLEIRPLDEVARISAAKSKNLTSMGICFCSEIEWQNGQVLLIDYFIPDELDSVRLKMVVVWSEFVDDKTGYFCGGKIVDIEKLKEDKFANYYYKKLEERT